MRSAIAAFAVLGIFSFGSDSVNFDGLKPGTLPPDWSVGIAPGRGAKWAVKPDASAPSRGNVLEKRTSGSAESESPVAVFDKVICRDGDLSVKFRIDGGGPVKTAGVVWRYQDPDNYYLLHFSADQRNIALFRIQNGKPEPLRVTEGKRNNLAIPHDIRVGQWYVTKVIFRGSRIQVLFGNRLLFEAEDGAISEPGRAGVWTKGRTNASFDDFRIEKKG